MNYVKKSEQLGLRVIRKLKKFLSASSTIEQFRATPTAFSRERLLTLPILVLTMLRAHKVSQQSGLNKVFRALDRVFSVPSASAYSQARTKLKPEIFVEMNRLVCEEYYKQNEQNEQAIITCAASSDKTTQLWHDRRLLGFDGIVLNLPDYPTIREAFSIQVNQYGAYVQGLAGVLYDLLGEIGLASDLGPKQGEQVILMSDRVWSQTKRGDVLVLDRNYVDFALLAWAVKNKRDVVIRCATNGFAVIQEFWNSSKDEAVVTLTLPNTPNTRRFVRENNLPESVQVRLIKFILPSGETEVILTTLCDTVAFPKQEFYTVYGKRWGEETYFDRIKNIFEVERFSGKTALTILQDFFSVIFLATLEGVLTRPAQAQLQQRDELRQNKTQAKVNRVNSYIALVDRIIELLADSTITAQETLTEIQFLFLQTPTRHKSGRQFKRLKTTPSRKYRYYRYTKRIIA